MFRARKIPIDIVTLETIQISVIVALERKKFQLAYRRWALIPATHEHVSSRLNEKYAKKNVRVK